MADKYGKFAKGVDAYMEGKYVYLRLNMEAKGEVSSSGAMTLNCNTGGFRKVDEESGFYISVMGGTKNAKNKR